MSTTLLVIKQVIERIAKQELPTAKTPRHTQKNRYKLAYARSPDAVTKAGLRPWLACVFVGVVLLLMAPVLPGAPGDGAVNRDLEIAGAMGAAGTWVATESGAPPQAPEPTGGLFGSGDGDAAGSLTGKGGGAARGTLFDGESDSARGKLFGNRGNGAAGGLFSSGGDEGTAGSVPLSAQPTRADPVAIFTTDSPVINAAKDEALAVLARDLMQQKGLAAHSAGPGYDAPWIRDSFAWGMIPNDTYPQLAPYAGSELRLWLGQQAANGQWVSNPQSGYFDETAILISAALDAYRITGDRALLGEALPRLRRGWAWLRSNTNVHDSTYLLWTPLAASGPRLTLPVAVDWADQIGRRNYAAQVNLLWFRATQSMAVTENVLGNPGEATRYAAFAEGIRTDFNRLLWTTGAVQARNAAPEAEFGHYRSWYPAERDYFELDTNFQAIVYGVADAEHGASILAFVSAHAEYLLGTAGGTPPARTVYGDYAPADYAQIRNKLGDGLYHNAYWLSIGGLAATAYQHAGDTAMQRRVLDDMAAAFGAGQAGSSASEWYDIVGKPGGVSAYQWSARSYLHALYSAYAGIDDDWTSLSADNLRIRAAGGEAIAQIRHLGKRLRVQTHGRGRIERVLIDGQAVSGTDVILEALLRDGSIIEVYAGE